MGQAYHISEAIREIEYDFLGLFPQGHVLRHVPHIRVRNTPTVWLFGRGPEDFRVSEVPEHDLDQHLQTAITGGVRRLADSHDGQAIKLPPLRLHGQVHDGRVAISQAGRRRVVAHERAAERVGEGVDSNRDLAVLLPES